MILIVTNRQDHTADYLILELRRRGADYCRFNTEDYPQRVKIDWTITGNVGEGTFRFPRAKVPFDRIRSIWYRRPLLPVPSPEITLPQYREFAIAESEAALHGVFAGLECFWVSKPETIRKAELKLYQLSMALKLGLDVSPTIVTNDEESAAQFYMRHNGEVVFKPLRRSRIVDGDEVQLLYTSKVGSAEARQFDRVAYTPTLLQRNLAKRLDIRVTVIGTRAFAVEIHSQDREVSSQDWRRAETASLVHSPHALPQDLETKCIQLVREMDLAFGALDFILTPEGDYQFLEINPNGQWAWIEQLCPEIPLRETLADLLLSGEA